MNRHRGQPIDKFMAEQRPPSTMKKAFAFGAGFFVMALAIGEIGYRLIKD